MTCQLEKLRYHTTRLQDGKTWLGMQERSVIMSNTNDICQVDYLPDEKKIKINLPEEVWRNIDTIIMTRLFQEELVVEKQEESEVMQNV